MPFKIFEVPTSSGKYELRVVQVGSSYDEPPTGARELATGITSVVMLGPCHSPASSQSLHSFTEVSAPADRAGTIEECCGTASPPGTSSGTSY